MITTGSLRLTILAFDRPVLALDQVGWVRLRLADEGLLTIYPRHAPLLAETAGGSIVYQLAGRQHQLELAAGLLTVRGDHVLLLPEEVHETK